MLIHIVGHSLIRQRRRQLLSLVSVALGVAVATAVAAMALDVGDKLNRELRSFGANIIATPVADNLSVTVGGREYRPAGSGAFLSEAALVNLKKIFWRNNILAFAPFLPVPASLHGRPITLLGTWFEKTLHPESSQVFVTGVKRMHPSWKVEGQWPGDSGPDENVVGCLLGERLARSFGLRVGQVFRVQPLTEPARTAVPASGLRLRVEGILQTGEAPDNQVLVPLAAAQKLAGLPGKIRSVEISALTKPEDDFARMDPRQMTPEQFEKWSCSPYVRSIAYQVEEALPGSVAKPVFRVADTEGRVLRRLSALMAVLAVAAVVAAALAVASMMLAMVLERRREIALFQCLGATVLRVAVILVLEVSVVGILGGLAGYAAGSLLARRLAAAIFGSPAAIHGALLPAAVTLALAVTWAGSAWPLLRGLGVPPAMALRQ